MVSSKFSRRKALDNSAKQKSPIVSRAPAVKKFDGDDEDMADQIEEHTSRIEAVPASPTDDSEADSDDDAPEAISTSAAATIAKQSAKAAQKAIQESAAAEKKKRQERDLKFKEQAAARKAREEKLEAEIAAAKALLAKPSTATSEEDDESRAARRRKTAALPDVLPLEFLDSDDSDNSDDDASHGKGADKSMAATSRTAKKIMKRTDADRVVGGTTYRVVKKTKLDLVPAAKKHTVHIKSQLLRRKRTGVPVKKGFLQR
ncbi:hypothetical protein Cpir12675_004660 [Ceratocystis pirilliformis]|uniref:Uncharacterized protein n=1 Tax=Ceratocystis pirilliformis TaxID=259994 RepID=A0ABR3YW86_9PEZI